MKSDTLAMVIVGIVAMILLFALNTIGCGIFALLLLFAYSLIMDIEFYELLTWQYVCGTTILVFVISSIMNIGNIGKKS